MSFWDWVMGQLADGSRGSQVTKCDPLSALLLTSTDTFKLHQSCKFPQAV